MKHIAELYNLAKIIGIKKLSKMQYAHKSMLRYARNYMVLHCIMALDNIGFIEAMSNKTMIDVREYALAKHLDKAYLKAVCDYLYSVGVFNRQDGCYYLSKKGQEDIDYSKSTFYFIYAYAPLFENLSSLLSGEKRYGKDVFRREKFVSEATAEVEKWIPLPVIKDLIKRYGFKNVLDLGCGSARFLIELCSGSNITGCGIDISKESIDLGKKLVKEKGLEKKITLTTGDIFNIEKASIEPNKIDVITSMYVLHEFLYENEDNLVSFLKHLKQKYENKFLLICEICKQSEEALRRKPTAIAEHHLFHALSRQGLITAEDWKKLFKRAGYKCIEEIHFSFAGQGYFLLK